MGTLFIVSGLSGSGKSSVVSEVMKHLPNSHRVVTVTTRQKREGEVDGTHYIYVSRRKFEQWILEGRFVEWAGVYGNFYGTPRTVLEEALQKYQAVFSILDIQGANALRSNFPQAVSVFIDCKKEVAIDRIMARGSQPGEIARRTMCSEDELRSAQTFDYRVVNLDGDFDRTVKRVIEVVCRYV